MLISANLSSQLFCAKHPEDQKLPCKTFHGWFLMVNSLPSGP